MDARLDPRRLRSWAFPRLSAHSTGGKRFRSVSWEPKVATRRLHRGIGGERPRPLGTAAKGGATCSFPGFYLDSLEFRVGQFRIPPKELGEMLPQQSLMLRVAAEAILDAGWDPSLAPPNRRLDRDRAGLELDQLPPSLVAGRPGARVEQDAGARPFARATSHVGSRSLRRAAGPALSANRTMGSLGGLIASRIAREFRIGGPSFTVSCDETSGIQAMAIAVDWLRRGDLDAAVVGAVDFAGDIRAVLARHGLAARAGRGQRREPAPDRLRRGRFPGLETARRRPTRS